MLNAPAFVFNYDKSQVFMEYHETLHDDIFLPKVGVAMTVVLDDMALLLFPA